MKVVLDVNVLVSAAIQRLGKSRQILSAAGLAYDWMTCEYILRKTAEVMKRSHIQKKYGQWLTSQDQTDFIAAARRAAHLVDIQSKVAVIGDQDDDVVLACAKDSQADYLVSGDPHLVDLETFEGTVIVSPDEFWRLLNR